MEWANLVISLLTALASLIKTIIELTGQGRNQKIKYSNERRNNPLKIGGKQLSSKISNKRLKKFKDELEVMYDLVYKNYELNNKKELYDNIEKARIEICSILSEIRATFNGNLPTKRLESLWEENKCLE